MQTLKDVLTATRPATAPAAAGKAADDQASLASGSGSSESLRDEGEGGEVNAAVAEPASEAAGDAVASEHHVAAAVEVAGPPVQASVAVNPDDAPTLPMDVDVVEAWPPRPWLPKSNVMRWMPVKKDGNPCLKQIVQDCKSTSTLGSCMEGQQQEAKHF